MTTLAVGATGATGMLLVQQLLDRGVKVKATVRSSASFPESIREHPDLSLTEASLHDLTDDEIAACVDGCSAVVSCLGHNLTLKGMFGHPRRLVTDATRRLCESLKESPGEHPRKFVLMNTTGVRNRDLNESVSFAQTCVVGLIRALLPPHADNEEAAEYLRTQIGQSDKLIEWVAVRPDGLIDLDAVTGYELHPSPTRSAIFDAGKTSRINVAHFMADLITDSDVWQQWKGQMPVIYNKP